MISDAKKHRKLLKVLERFWKDFGKFLFSILRKTVFFISKKFLNFLNISIKIFQNNVRIIFTKKRAHFSSL